MLSVKTPFELQRELSHRLRHLRLDRGYSQQELAGKSAVSLRALRALEGGAHSSVTTLVKVLHALGSVAEFDTIAPRPEFSPIESFRGRTERQRVGRPRNKRTQ